MAKVKTSLPDSYTCSKCKTENEFPPYVFAHWSTELIHTCKCKTKYRILHGFATRLGAKK